MHFEMKKGKSKSFKVVTLIKRRKIKGYVGVYLSAEFRLML